ncbi:IS5 family transposase [Synergistaceae bacterium OttesenSCG-928-I11]|nr:IS5 family transposase [Synergistaceae bacterium OttesenSCG-928-I11]
MSRHNLSDESWNRIKELLPPERSGKKGRPAKDNRLIVNAILWILYTGSPWRDLPEEFGSWKSVYTRFRRWSQQDIWEKVFAKLSEDQDLENVMIDGTYIRAHQHAAGAKGGQEKQALGRSRGGFTTKIHAIVDALGNPLKLFLTGGEVHDIVPAPDLLSDFSDCTVLADKGYDSNALVSDLESRNITVVIPPRSNRKDPRDYDYHLYKERHLVECFFNKIKQFRRIATRYEKLAESYLAMVMIAASIIWLK